MGCIRCLLCLFNFFLWLSGAALIAVGALVTKWYGSYMSFTDGNFPHAAFLVIGVGVIVFLVGFLGCCGAMTGNYCMLMTFSILMGIIFLAEVAVTVLSFTYKSQIKKEAVDALDRAVKKYDSDKVGASFINLAQTAFKCCGKSGPADYSGRSSGIPGSCCNKKDSESCTSSEAYSKGCNTDLQAVLDRAFKSVGLSSIGIACGHLIAIVFACYYMRSIKRKESKGDYTAPSQGMSKKEERCWNCLDICLTVTE